MLRRRAFYCKLTKVPLAPDIHRVCMFNTPLIEPFMNFPVTDNLGIGLLSNGYTICNMITMAMRQKDKMWFDRININSLRQVIVANKWIEQDLFSRCFYHETRVAEICEFHFYCLMFRV